MDGMKMRELRKASGKTLREVSIESDVTEAQILNIENGSTREPRITTLVAIARAIGCKVGDFLDEDE